MAGTTEWSRPKIERELRSFLVDELFYDAERGAIPGDLPLQEAGVIDSMGMLRLVTFIEETFGIEVLDGEVVPEHFRSLDDIISFVERKRSAR